MNFFKLNLIAGLVGVGLFAASATQAQSNENTTPNAAPKGSTEIVNLTGCLARGDKAHMYSMKDENGKTYELLPAAGINMKKHVGEKVMITGTRTKKHEANEYLRVRQVARVDASCS